MWIWKVSELKKHPQNDVGEWDIRALLMSDF